MNKSVTPGMDRKV